MSPQGASCPLFSYKNRFSRVLSWPSQATLKWSSVLTTYRFPTPLPLETKPFTPYHSFGVQFLLSCLKTAALPFSLPPREFVIRNPPLRAPEWSITKDPTLPLLAFPWVHAPSCPLPFSCQEGSSRSFCCPKITGLYLPQRIFPGLFSRVFS